MNITLSTYKPFSNTQELMAYGKKNWESPSADLIDLVQKIGKLAVTIIALLPTLLLDLSLSCVSYVYQACYQEDTKVNITPNPPNLAIAAPTQPAANPKKNPTQAQIDAICQHPYSNRQFPNGNDHVGFFTDAWENAFDLIGEEEATEYKNLIRYDGIEEDGAEPSVEIFKWSAECLLIHYLRVRNQAQHRATQYFPARAVNPEEGANIDFSPRLNLLWNQYRILSPEQKAAAVLSLILPNERWDLKVDTLKFVRDLQGLALDITRYRNFSTHICGPASMAYKGNN